MGVNRHRLSAGRHLSAGQLVRLTQDIYTYGNPCLNGGCIEITCDNPLPQCCQYEDILDALGVAGSDSSKPAEDENFYGPSGAFQHGNGVAKMDNFFGIGAINAFVPNHTQLFSENRNNSNDAASDNHAPVFNITSNLNYARYHPEKKVHDPIPNVNYSALKKVIASTPAFSLGESSDLIDSLPTKANSGGIDHAFDRMTNEVVENSPEIFAPTRNDPRVDPYSSDTNASEGQYRSFGSSFCESLLCNYSTNICLCCGDGDGQTPCPDDCTDINACASAQCQDPAAECGVNFCSCIISGSEVLCCRPNNVNPCRNDCGENLCSGNPNGCECTPEQIQPNTDPCDEPDRVCQSPCDLNNPCSAANCQRCVDVDNPDTGECGTACVDNCFEGQLCCAGTCKYPCPETGGCPDCGSNCCPDGEQCCSFDFCAPEGCCDCPESGCCNGSCCVDGQVCWSSV
jgi:hypothetical protein